MMAEHVTRPTDDVDDEDLELLRIAALKSINAKKEQATHRSPPARSTGATSSTATHPIQATSKSYSTIPVKQSRNPTTSAVGHDNSNLLTMTSQSYYPNLPLQQSRTSAPAIDNFSTRQRLEQLDINEPYVPQRVPPLPSNGQPPNVGSNGGWLPEPAAMGTSTYPSYIQPKVGEPLPVGVNVQLSPRSMAFVAQNNDILMRRKGENVSPAYAYRSPSPAYRNSPASRWSKSPSPPPKMGRSPGPRSRPHHYSSHRRSASRSPPPNRPRSPPIRRRTVSRSPPPHPGQHVSRHQSPNPFNRYPSRSPPPHNRRVKSRTPPAHNAKHKMSPPRRHMSRSPLPHMERPSSRSPPPLNGRRSPVGSLRYANRNRRSLSPPHNRKRSPVGNHEAVEMPQRHHLNRDRRSPLHMNIHRRSASPTSARQRSHSRSPHRRYGRKSRERNVNVPQRRRSPYTNNRRRYEGPGSNGLRNNARGRKRSGSPVMQDRQIRRSRTRSPDRNRRINKRPRRVDHADRRAPDDHYRNDSKRPDDRRSNQVQNPSQTRKDRDEEMHKHRETSPCPPPAETCLTNEDKQIKGPEPSTTGKATVEPENNTPEPTATNMEVEKEEASSDEEEEDDEDGIDLFASEDSESENEGRFKSSTSKNERTAQAATLSFTKLGETRPVEVKELADVEANHNRDRDRDRSHNNYGRSRGNGNNNFRDNNRNGRDQDRRNKNNLNNKNRRERDRDRGERERVDRDWDSPMNRAGEEKRAEGGRIGAATVDRPMFKSTFQALETEGRSSRKNSRERETSDRKVSSNSRRRNPSKDRKASPNNEVDYASNHPTTSSSTTTKGAVASSNPTSSLPSSPSRGTKPIHLRLGAKTNTFKPAKKASTSSSSSTPRGTSSSGNGSTEKV